MGKSWRNVHQKLVPDLFLNLVNNPKQPLYARNSFKNKIFWKRIIKKPQKGHNIIFFFRTQFLLNDKIVKNKRDLKLVTSCSSGYKISLDQVWWCNIKRLLSYSKNYISKFMQANSWHHKVFRFLLFFYIWKMWKGREKITNIWKSLERKELFRWNKKSFS